MARGAALEALAGLRLHARRSRRRSIAHEPDPTRTVPFQVYNEHSIERIEPLRRLPESERTAIRAVAQVLPFRVNAYVLEELVDWSRVPEDPMFRLVFPQREMLAPGGLR